MTTTKTPGGTTVRCNRCRSRASTEVITRYFGRENLCLPCARVVLTDRQCGGVVQPPQPPGLMEEVNRKRAEVSAYLRGVYGRNEPPRPPLETAPAA